MPIIKSSIKRVKQDKGRTARNRIVKNRMKSFIKLMMESLAKGEVDKAKKMFPKAASAIDMATKRNLIHKKNAARKKSLLERTLTVAIKNPKAAVSAKEAKKAKKA